MIKFEEIKNIPERLNNLAEIEDIFEINGIYKLESLCTVIAITQDLKYIVNTDSCDYYQFEKFNKKEILAMAEELKQIGNKMKGDVK